MTHPAMLAVASDISNDWARRGGPRAEFGIVCRGASVSAIAEMAVGKRWDDAARRAALGALVPMACGDAFGYIADTTLTVDGTSSEGLVLLELQIIDAVARAVGAKVHVAPYVRSKKRFGTDTIHVDAFTRYDFPAFGEMVTELAATWHLVGDDGRLGAMNVLSETGVQMSDLDPGVHAELQALLGQPV